ncbi:MULTISPECIES: PucR family transcriptional regulator [Gordonibacter]|uniref:Helix-turn-helix domain-containing protein n=1 Tax=Gordonibacter faecis TaxID=3047475 RepID=A0ABT7DSU4_9ACTN|nr:MULTISPECIES: helix-turn-helix domain-containing protein [unclassified Gordonibacter]MDJ1651601.1 helix-turn-helix domain-containing protein [Gordonibacter sp. KGMB12511]HIW77023.1 helix-turn-helix domain-containing protein [Candidatus Gordonibacter avicola]
MFLNAYVVASKLQGVTDSYLRSDSLEARLSFAAPLTESRLLAESCLYVAVGEDLARIAPSPTEGSYSIVSIGPPPAELIENEHFDIVIVRPLRDLSTVLQQVEDLFALFNDWQQGMLLELVSESASLDRLLSRAVPIFGNPIELFGEKFQVLGRGQTEAHFIPDCNYDKETGFMARDLMDRFGHNEAFARSHDLEGPHVDLSLESAFFNIRKRGKFVARLVIPFIDRDCDEGDLYPLIVLADIVKQYLLINQVSVFGLQSSFKKALQRFFFSSDQSDGVKKTAVSAINRLGWGTCDPYQAICIVPDFSSVAINALYYQCLELEKEIWSSVAMLEGSEIFLLVNLSGQQSGRNAVLDQLDELSQEHCFVAGTSTVFDDFSQAPVFFRQARATAFMAVEHEAQTYGVYSFEKYRLAFVLTNGLYELPSVAIIPASLQAVIDYDSQHGTEYYDTLKTYLKENLNVSATAGCMCVHGGTMRYRIKRLEEMLCDLDLQTVDDRLFLQCVFMLIDGLYSSAS